MPAPLSGADPHVHGGDNPAELSAALDQLSPSHDLIITSGGVSAGAFDVVHTVLGRTDSAWFGHVDQRPGAPQGYSLWNDTPVLCLPGNPVAAFVDFQLYARPLIAALSGHPAPRQRVNLRARVESPLPASRGRPTIVPVTVDFQAAPAIPSHLPTAVTASCRWPAPMAFASLTPSPRPWARTSPFICIKEQPWNLPT